MFAFLNRVKTKPRKLRNLRNVYNIKRINNVFKNHCFNEETLIRITITHHFHLLQIIMTFSLEVCTILLVNKKLSPYSKVAIRIDFVDLCYTYL